VKTSAWFLTACILPVLSAFGCGSSSVGADTDTGADPGITGDVPGAQDPGPGDVPLSDVPVADNPPAGDPAPDAVPQMISCQVLVSEIGPTGAETVMPGVQVTLLSDPGGSPTGQSATSDAEGHVTFQVMSDETFGVKLAKSGDLDSYSFGFSPQDSPADASILSQAMADNVLTLLGATQDPAKGMASGTVRFGTGSGIGDPIGCATVQSTPSGQVFYFDASGPRTLADLPSTAKAKGDFLVLNVPAGAVALTAKVNGTEIATGAGRVFPGAITFRIVVSSTGAVNPTPADCAQ